MHGRRRPRGRRPTRATCGELDAQSELGLRSLRGASSLDARLLVSRRRRTVADDAGARRPIDAGAARPAHRRAAPGARRPATTAALRARAVHAALPALALPVRAQRSCATHAAQLRRAPATGSTTSDAELADARARAAATRCSARFDALRTDAARAPCGIRVHGDSTSARCCGPAATSCSSTSRASRLGRSASAASSVAAARRRRHAALVRLRRPRRRRHAVERGRVREQRPRAALETLGHAVDARGCRPAFLAATCDARRRRRSCRATPSEPRPRCSTPLLEKALYELRYELDNRPDWVGIPLLGAGRADPALRDGEARSDDAVSTTQPIGDGRPAPLQRGHPPPPLRHARRPARSSGGTWFAVWAPERRARSPSSATSTAGRGRRTGSSRAGDVRHLGGLRRRRSTPGTATSTGCRARRRHRGRQGRPVRRPRRDAAGDGVGRRRPRLRVGRRRVDGRPRGAPGAVDAPMSIYEVHLGSWGRTRRRGRPVPDATRAGRRRSPTTCSPTASPTSSCCRSWSTRSTARGATRPPATSPRPPATAARRTSWR